MWDVVCQYCTWQGMLPWTRTTEQHIRELQGLRHQQKTLSSFVPPSELYLLFSPQAPSDHPQCIYCLQNLQYCSVFFYLALKTTAYYHSPSFLIPLKPQESYGEAAAFGPHAEFIHPSKSQ